MPEVTRYVIVGLIVLLGNFQQGVTGFGSNVLALPFVILLLGLHRAVPLLVVQAWVLAALMVWESHRHIDWRQCGKILLLGAAGQPVGLWLAGTLPEHALRWALVAFMSGVGAEGLVREGRRASADAPDAERVGADAPDAPTAVRSPARWFTLLVPVGGIMNGAFGTGGPPIVVYADRAMRDKSVFRATLSMVWLVLDTILVAVFIATGRLDQTQLWLNLLCLPATLAGMWTGTHTHYRMNEHAFRLSVYAVLVMAAGVLAWSLLK